MKRLLTPLLALSLAACGNNDIVVTSEVGEKMIVERDTIRLKKDSSSLVLKKIKAETIGIMEDTEELLCKDGEDDLCLKQRQEVKAAKHEQKLSNGPVWMQEWRYLPVKRDRNGTETVQKEKFVRCYSPNLTDEDKELLNSNLITKLSTYDGYTLGDSVARTICDEYPKWEVKQ